MEYQKNNEFVRQYTKSTISQKFKIKYWVEINDELHGS